MTVFAVLAHADPAQLSRLVGRLAPHPVVVHVDGRRSLEPFRQALASHDHVVLLERDRVTTAWGGLSLLDAQMTLTARAAALAGPGEQIVLLSGQCYPLRPVDEIVRALRDTGRPLFVRGVRYAEVADRSRTNRYHFYDLFPVRQTGWRRIASGVPRKVAQTVARIVPRTVAGEDSFVLGSQWTVLTKEAVEDVLVPRYRTMRRDLRMVFAPEEVFVPTVVHTTALAGLTQVGGPDEHDGDVVARYANVHLLDETMTKTFTDGDWSEVAASDALFVRKVSGGPSDALLDRLDERDAASG